MSVICVLLAALIVSLIIYATHRDSSKKETATPTDASTETEEATETEEPTTVTTTEAETTMEEVEETTEETTEETVTTEAVQNAVSETDFPVENSVGGLSYSEAAKDQDQHFFVEHNDCYYPMTNSECFDENMVSLKIRFVEKILNMPRCMSVTKLLDLMVCMDLNPYQLLIVKDILFRRNSLHMMMVQ